VALNAVTAVLLPSATTRFWTSAMLSGDGATFNAWFGNQSLNGVLHASSDRPPGSSTAWW
jgi:alpha-1,2-mannosyltransferase